MKEKILAALSGNSLIHGAIMALISAIGVAIAPLLESLQSGVFPTVQQLEQDGIHALLLGFGAGIAYLLKNMFAGSSNKTV